jgi:hypothetical protein
MFAFRRTALAAATLSLALAGAARAQIPGMPLFTNPRYGTGIRVHADLGRPTDTKTAGDVTVVQGGVSFALGPVGLNANVGLNRNSLSSTTTCVKTPTLSCVGNKVTASALAQLRLFGGGTNNISVSAFGGGSVDITGYDAALYTYLGTVPSSKLITIPVGAAIGLHVPLGFGGLNLWGAPRMNFYQYANCSGTCPSGTSMFRWALGADLPILRVLSVRAAFDSGSKSGVTTSYWGVGASLGIGGMR